MEDKNIKRLFESLPNIAKPWYEEGHTRLENIIHDLKNPKGKKKKYIKGWNDAIDMVLEIIAEEIY